MQCVGFRQATSISDALKPVLNEIIDSIAQYSGDLSALDEPMEVLCKYICCLRADGMAIEPQWLAKIKLLDEVHPNAMDPGLVIIHIEMYGKSACTPSG